ncbi:MAG: hypothetical protein Q8K36_00445, partial [Alphaproteobacteria bacterium]|nr:hypothetical protein [Alphaproteobacteria bacterium]
PSMISFRSPETILRLIKLALARQDRPTTLSAASQQQQKSTTESELTFEKIIDRERFLEITKNRIDVSGAVFSRLYNSIMVGGNSSKDIEKIKAIKAKNDELLSTFKNLLAAEQEGLPELWNQLKLAKEEKIKSEHQTGMAIVGPSDDLRERAFKSIDRERNEILEKLQKKYPKPAEQSRQSE